MERLWRQVDDVEPDPPARLQGFSLALIVTVAGCSAGLALQEICGVRLPFLGGVVGTLCSALLAGAGPGLLATVFHAAFLLLANHLAPDDRLTLPNAASVFLVEIGFVWLGATLRGSRTHLNEIANRLQERQSYLQSIFDNLPAPMLVLDATTVVRSASREACAMLGVGPSQVLGRRLEDVLPALNDLDLSTLRTPCSGALRPLEIVTTRLPNGRVAELEIFWTCTETGHGPLHTLFTRDVTEQHARTQQMNELRDELAHMSRVLVLGELGAAIAHELNQPLAAAENYIGSARVFAACDGDREALRSALTEASKELLRAAGILKHLHRLVKRSTVEHVPASPAELTAEMRPLAELAARELRGRITFHVPASLPSVWCNRIQVQQVLLNLVRNGLEACHYSSAGLVEVTAAAVDDRYVCFMVSDNGPGLPDALRARLFQPFNTSKDHGLGVGLAVCRTIIEAHDGRIWLDTSSGDGAHFCFTLRIANG